MSYLVRQHRLSLVQIHYLRQHCRQVWKLLLQRPDFDYSPQIVRADSKIPAVLKVED